MRCSIWSASELIRCSPSKSAREVERHPPKRAPPEGCRYALSGGPTGYATLAAVGLHRCARRHRGITAARATLGALSISCWRLWKPASCSHSGRHHHSLSRPCRRNGTCGSRRSSRAVWRRSSTGSGFHRAARRSVRQDARGARRRRDWCCGAAAKISAAWKLRLQVVASPKWRTA